MGTRFEPLDVRKQWKELFGTDSPTVRQAWFLTKLAKHVRLRCRNNSAFNNFMNESFGNGLIFRETTKTNQYGEEYDGLEIVEKNPTAMEQMIDRYKEVKIWRFVAENGNATGYYRFLDHDAREYAHRLSAMWQCTVQAIVVTDESVRDKQ